MFSEAMNIDFSVMNKGLYYNNQKEKSRDFEKQLPKKGPLNRRIGLEPQHKNNFIYVLKGRCFITVKDLNNGWDFTVRIHRLFFLGENT